MELHRQQIAAFGGDPSIRDGGLLESALAQLQATFGGVYLAMGLPEMAAAYLFHVAASHPFVDGNKRAALACALMFLHLNGQELEVEDQLLYNTVIAVASGRMEKPELESFFRAHVRPIG